MENLQQSLMLIMLVSLAILFSPCFQQSAAASVIQEACRDSVDIDFCVSSLSSDPRSINANLKELTVIAIDIAKRNGTALLDYITNQWIGNSTTIDPYIKICQEQYQNAVKDLGNASISFNGGDYASTNKLLESAKAESLNCGSPTIVVQEVPTILVQLSNLMFQICDDAVEVLCKYSSYCAK